MAMAGLPFLPQQSDFAPAGCLVNGPKCKGASKMATDKKSTAPAHDMGSLKRRITQAGSDFESVREVLESCTFFPREQAFTKILIMCGRLGDSQKAMNVFKTMKHEVFRSRGLKPNKYTYSALIAACSSAGEWDLALDVFRDMKSAAESDMDSEPNWVTYGTVIGVCERAGEFEKAVEFFDEMREKGIEADRITLLSVLETCMKGGKWARAEAIMENLHARNMDATPRAYTEFLNHCAEVGDWAKAVDVFLMMQIFGHDVGIAACGAVMRALEAGSQARMAIELFREMREARIPVDYFTYQTLLRILHKAGMWLEAHDLATEGGVGIVGGFKASECGSVSPYAESISWSIMAPSRPASRSGEGSSFSGMSA